MKSEKIRVTAISIEQGVIKLIEPDGSIGTYSQRGIRKLSYNEREMAISRGFITPMVLMLRELPLKYAIEFDEPTIMGKAKASFSMPK